MSNLLDFPGCAFVYKNFGIVNKDKAKQSLTDDFKKLNKISCDYH